MRRFHLKRRHLQGFCKILHKSTFKIQTVTCAHLFKSWQDALISNEMPTSHYVKSNIPDALVLRFGSLGCPWQDAAISFETPTYLHPPLMVVWQDAAVLCSNPDAAVLKFTTWVKMRRF